MGYFDNVLLRTPSLLGLCIEVESNYNTLSDVE